MERAALDRQRLQQCLELAQQAIGLSDPNPRVGCVLAAADGRVAATGFTQAAGDAHAEAAALAQARAAGIMLRGGSCLGQPGALRPPRPHAAVLRCTHRSRHRARGGGGR